MLYFKNKLIRLAALKWRETWARQYTGNYVFVPLVGKQIRLKVGLCFLWTRLGNTKGIGSESHFTRRVSSD